MEKVLKEISEIIQQYNKMISIDGGTLNLMIKQLSTRLYYLETERAEYHKKFQGIIFKLTQEGKSVSRAENQAHVEVPEMYLLRRIMDAGYRVTDAMRTNISYLKHEMNHSGNN